MALAAMTRAQTVTKARIILGVTDATKGGPTDSVFEGQIDSAQRRFAVRAKALQTVIKLATKANDKYLPLVDEILWPISVSFVDSDGLSKPLDFDLTAVNCQELNVTVTGAAVGDEVFIGVPNPSVVADATWCGWVSSTNTVTVRMCDGVGASNPLSGTYKITVFQ